MQVEIFFRRPLTVSMLALILSWSSASAMAQQKPEKPLYQRLGAYDALASSLKGDIVEK